MQGVWLSPTKFVDFSEPAASALGTELAVRMGAVMDGWMGILPDPDPVLQKSGEGIAALEALAADAKATTSMQTRKLKTLGRNSYSFSPGQLKGGKPTPEAIALCDALTRDLERVDLYNLMGEVLDAPYYGLTVAELLWQTEPGRMRLTGIVPKPRKWFVYDMQNALRFTGDGSGYGMLTDSGQGTLPPFGKFVVARHFPTYENPYGLRLLSRCLFPVAFKRGGIEFMMRFAERWGMPWIIGEGRSGAPRQELGEMRDALVGMVRDAVAVITGGSKVQLLQAGGQSGDLHLSIVEYWDKAIAQVLQGQTLTSDIGDKGSYGAAKAHAGVLDDFAEADATLVKIFFDELAWAYGQINAPGVLTPTFGFDEPDDQAARANLGKELHAQGVRFTPQYFERRFGLAPDEFTVAPATAQPPATAFAEPAAPVSPASQGDKSKARFTPGQQAIEDLVADLLPQGVKEVEVMTAQILKLVDQAETPEELQELLAAALAPARDGGLDHSGFQSVVETALFAADMTGRFSARENVL